MEPLRGGRLASLSEENAAELKTMHPDEEIPAWAFRFLQTIPNVTVILSGMSNFEQLRDNIYTFYTDKPLNAQELDTLRGIADSIVKATALPCTACRYCVGHCPQQLNIPVLIALYNEHCFTNDGGLFAFIAPMALAAMPENKRPAACIGCKSCEAVCPQKIGISEVLKDFSAKLNA